MNTEMILTCILSSTVAAAVITSIKEILLWRLNRKAQLHDVEREEERADIDAILKEQREDIKNISSTVKNLQDQMNATMQHDKIILRDKIKYLIFKYLEYGKITLDEKQAIHHMWDIYHHGLKGNGDLDELMELLDEIPVVHCHVVGGCYGETHRGETSVQ